MIKFSAAMPFPLLAPETHSYSQAQNHSKEVDGWLGLATEEIERDLAVRGCHLRGPGAGSDKQELWIGLATQSLLTPYTEIRNILWKLKPQAGETIIDLGAAYGRMGFVIGRHYPQVKFIGYEFVGERVREAKRCLDRFSYPFVKMEHVDLSAPEFILPKAEFYFIYDYGTQKAIEKTLHDLRRLASERSITVIGRGRLCRDLIERRHPWLSQVVEPEHLGHYSIYRSAHLAKKTPNACGVAFGAGTTAVLKPKISDVSQS